MRVCYSLHVDGEDALLILLEFAQEVARRVEVGSPVVAPPDRLTRLLGFAKGHAASEGAAADTAWRSSGRRHLESRGAGKHLQAHREGGVHLFASSCKSLDVDADAVGVGLAGAKQVQLNLPAAAARLKGRRVDSCSRCGSCLVGEESGKGAAWKWNGFGQLCDRRPARKAEVRQCKEQHLRQMEGWRPMELAQMEAVEPVELSKTKQLCVHARARRADVSVFFLSLDVQTGLLCM